MTLYARYPGDPRAAAMNALVASLHGDVFAGEALRRSGGLDPRNAGLARQIAYTALRRALTIEHVLSAVARYEPDRVRIELRAALLAGAAQIFYLDRIPDFAAVGETVRIVRDAHGRSGAGMVNAVLRNLGRAIDARVAAWSDRGPHQRRLVRRDWGSACLLAADVFPDANSEGEAAYLAAATGERQDRVVELVRCLGGAAAAGALWACQAEPPMVVQRNPLRAAGAEFVKAILECDATAEFDHPAEPTCAFCEGDSAIIRSDLFRSGGAYVQDVTARDAVNRIQAQPGERIADWCAAPGGKTMALAIDQRDGGVTVALDESEPRLRRVAENVARLGLKSIQMRMHGGGMEPDLKFDAVLVDVPCSNSGVIARRPEARLDRGEKKLKSLRDLQTRILAEAARTVRGGGRLVYSTCSVDSAENEEIVTAFANAHPGWRMEACELTLPHWGARKSDWRDGGFAARLRRVD